MTTCLTDAGISNVSTMAGRMKEGRIVNGEICGDNRFEIIEAAKKRLLEATNIHTRPDEIAVLDSLLYRMWQIGWLPGCRDKRSDAKSVRHGHWIEQFPDDVYIMPKCSLCGYVSLHDVGSNYCPNCGAKMDEKED